MKIDFTQLVNLQKELDKNIQNKFNISSAETINKKILALLVELGEFANETRCFKYWSVKGPNDKDVILEEYVDGLHFILSIGNNLKQNVVLDHDFKKSNPSKENLTNSINDLFYKISLLLKPDKYTKETHEAILIQYIQVAIDLGWNIDEVFDSYIKKNIINHQRQKNNY